LDIAGAVESLPNLSLTANELNAAKATGTDDSAISQLVPTIGKMSTLESIVDQVASEADKQSSDETLAVSVCTVKGNKPLTTPVNGLQKERETGFEPATSSLGS
jgi:hypothetical protein